MPAHHRWHRSLLSSVSSRPASVGCNRCGIRRRRRQATLPSAKSAPLAVDRLGRASDAKVATASPMSRARSSCSAAASLPARQPRHIRRHAGLEPAEIIGLRPCPLVVALSRTRHRRNLGLSTGHYGYQNLRSFPLLVSFTAAVHRRAGQLQLVHTPRYTDDLAGRLVNYYIDRLLSEPHLHDKVEFEIIFSCYTLDLPNRMGSSPSGIFSPRPC